MSTVRPWLLFSSSSGQTLRAVAAALSAEERAALKGVAVDRPCGAIEAAREAFGPSVPVVEFPRREFEAESLKWMASLGFRDGLILLCGFFAILKADFLDTCGSTVVNTHPSLLPAFPGKDEKVHEAANRDVAISGFSVHLVNETLDGGAILYQHPVALDPSLDTEANRARVRAAEQYWLPRVWSRLLRSGLEPADRHRSSLEVRRRLKLSLVSFEAPKEFL